MWKDVRDELQSRLCVLWARRLWLWELLETGECVQLSPWCQALKGGSAALLQNQKTKEQIESLLQDGKHQELRERLCCRLSFGTAGLRSAMGAGFCYINDLTVIQSTQVSWARPARAPAPGISSHPAGIPDPTAGTAAWADGVAWRGFAGLGDLSPSPGVGNGLGDTKSYELP